MPDGSDLHASSSAAAFEALYRDQWEAVVNYLRFRIGPADAHDVASETFVRAWAHRRAIEDANAHPEAWLWAIARNAATDVLRRRGSDRSSIAPPASEAADPQETAVRRLDLAQALSAMHALSARDREIIALRFGAGHTNRAIGAALGMSEGNVAVRLHRALLRLREDLEGGAKE
jgi:RNA polymerase sigma-70 factor, ECF subfamily